jgi:hypothetical protein
LSQLHVLSSDGYMFGANGAQVSFLQSTRTMNTVVGTKSALAGSNIYDDEKWPAKKKKENPPRKAGPNKPLLPPGVPRWLLTGTEDLA